MVTPVGRILYLNPVDKPTAAIRLWLCSSLVWLRDAETTMMTSSNGNIFRVTGPLCGEFTGPGEFPTQRPVTRSFDVSFDLRLNKRSSKQPWGWWFDTPSWSSWRQCNEERSQSVIGFTNPLRCWNHCVCYRLFLNMTSDWLAAN